MKRHILKENLLDLVQNNLSEKEAEAIISILEKSGMNREEIESLRSLYRLIDESPSPHQTDKMDKRFYAMLEEEKRKAVLGEPEIKPERPLFYILLSPGLKVAAGIALFLLGWFSQGWFGTSSAKNDQLADLSGEIKELKETLVVTMMQQSSTVERIKAVNMAGEFDIAANQIIENLIKILNTDSNDNVRLLALEALIRYSSVDKVREALVSSITNQSSPMVQLRLAEIMLTLNEKRAVPAFRKILEDASLNYSVRGKIKEAVSVLL